MGRSDQSYAIFSPICKDFSGGMWNVFLETKTWGILNTLVGGCRRVGSRPVSV